MEILVNGSSVLAYAIESTLRISSTINSRSTASFALRDPAGSYDVAVGRSVQIYDGVGTTIFGGSVEEVTKRVLEDNLGVELQLQCVSHEQRLDKRVVQSKIYTDTNCGAVVADLITQWADGEAIFLDAPSSVQAGADVDRIIYDYDKRLSEALDELATLSNYVWFVDPDGYLFFVPRTFYTAPWTLTNADILDGTAVVQRSRSDLRNREYYRVNWAAKAESYNFFNGDGSNRSFTLLDESAQPNPVNRIERMIVQRAEGASAAFTADPGTETLSATGHPFANGDVVRLRNSGGTLPGGLSASRTYYVVNRAANTFQLSTVDAGSPVNITSAGTGTHTAFIGGNIQEVSWGVDGVDAEKEFWWEPGSAIIRQDNSGDVLTAEDTLEVWYRALGDDVFMVDDSAAIAARAAAEAGTGIYEHITDDQQAVLLHEAVAKANSLVAAYKNIALAVEFTTVRAGLKPGQVITASVTKPSVSGVWLIESVEYAADLTTGENQFRYRVKIIDGSRIGGWLQFWEKLAGALTGGAGISLGGSTDNPPDIPTITVPNQLSESGWTVEIGEYGATLAGQPMARIRVTVSERPSGTDYFSAWLYEGATPPADTAAFVNAGNQPIADSGDTALDLWVERESEDTTYQVAITASNQHTFVVPVSGTVVKSIVIEAAEAAAQVTGFEVTVNVTNNGGVGSGRYFVAFTPPADLEYFTTRIDRIWCDASFNPVTGAEWLETFNLVDGNFQQDSYWPLPTNAEFWKFRARTVTRAGIFNDNSPPTVNVTVPASGTLVGVNIPEQITLGTPQWRDSLPDAQGKIYVEITVPVTIPEDWTGDRLYYQLQAPDDAGDKAEIGIDLGWTIPGTVNFTVDAGNDLILATGHPFSNGNYVRVRTTGVLPGGLSGSSFYYVANALANSFQLSPTLAGTPVNITGSGSGTHSIFIAEFAGVLPLNQPEEQGVKMWAEAEGLVKVRHPKPPKAETWRLYVAAGSASYTPPIVRADVAGATPNVAIDVGSPGTRGNGEEYAPLAQGFAAINASPYENGVRYDRQEGGDLLYGIGVQWTAPDLTEHPEIGGYDVVIRYSDGRTELATSPSANDTPVWYSDQWPLKSTGATFQLYLVTWDVTGRRNSLVPHLTPSVTITVAAPDQTPGVEYAPVATGFAARNNGTYTNGVRYTVSNGGQALYGVSATWDDPDLSNNPQLGGYDIVIEYNDGRRSLTASFSANDEPIWISDEWPLQQDGTFDVWLVSYDTNNRRNSIVNGLTPKITISVSFQIGVAGAEYTANVSNFNVGTFDYPENGQGQRRAVVPVTITKPADARFGYWILYVDGPGFTRKQFSGPEYSETLIVDFTGYPWTNESWTFYAVSHDTNGRANTNAAPSYVPGTFETVTVGPVPLGSAGVEYTSLVGNPASGSMFEADTQWRATQEGVEEFRVVCNWSNPDDPTFGGAKIVLKKTNAGSEEFFTGEYQDPGATQGSTKWRAIVDGEKFVAYIVSIDVNNRENSIVDGITPKSGEYTLNGSATGTLKASRVSPATLGAGLAVVGNVLRVPLAGVVGEMVDNFAISKNKLENLPIIDSFRVESAAITNAKLDHASANKIAIVDADIVGLLAVNKLAAGTITAAISMTSASLNVSNGTKTLRFNFGGDDMAIYDTGVFAVARLSASQLNLQTTTNTGNVFDIAMNTTNGLRITGWTSNAIAALTANASGAAFALNRGTGIGQTVEIFTADQSPGGGVYPGVATGYLRVRIDGITRNIPYF